MVIACLSVFSPWAIAAPTLTSSHELATAGYFRLSWSTPPHQDVAAVQYELQEAKDKQFSRPKTIYEGSDNATVISGLPDHIYFYRIREKGSTNWSPVLQVEVRHHSLMRAFGFFVLGAVMFASMLAVLIKGVRREAMQ